MILLDLLVIAGVGAFLILVVFDWKPLAFGAALATLIAVAVALVLALRGDAHVGYAVGLFVGSLAAASVYSLSGKAGRRRGRKKSYADEAREALDHATAKKKPAKKRRRVRDD